MTSNILFFDYTFSCKSRVITIIPSNYITSFTVPLKT